MAAAGIRRTLERFDQDVLPLRPANLLILTGSNSLRADTSAEEIIKDLDDIQKKCSLHGIRPIFLTLLPLNPERIQLAFHIETDPTWKIKLNLINAWIRSQVYYIDIEPYFYDAKWSVLNPLLSTDGLHPDVNGKRMMADLINQHRDLLSEIPEK